MAALTVERLRLLHAVAAHGTITGAANESGYTASAVSQQLSALERELGISLFERSNRGVTLTPAGARLSEHASTILDLVRVATVEATQAGPQAAPITIRIGAFPTAISSIIVPAMAILDPLVRLTIVHVEPEQALSELTAHRLDAAVVDFYDNQPGPIRPGVRHVTLMTDRLRLAIRSDRPTPTQLTDLAQLPWVLAGPDSRLGRVALGILRTAGIEPSVLVETDDHRVAFDVMSAIDAATIQPDLALRAAPSHVTGLRGIDLRCERHIHLVTRDVLRPHPAFPALESALRAAGKG